MKNKAWRSLLLGLATGAAIFAVAAPQPAFATDDFGRIVRHIETEYHVHRQHRLVMGFAGFVVRFYHFAGVKGLKGAIFEDQPFLNAGADSRMDEIVRASTNSGWQPMVQSWDRHTGEKTFIYAQDLSSGKGKDLRVLLVSLEPNEAVVLQVKMDAEKFNDFIRQTSAGHNPGGPSAAEEGAPVAEEPLIVAAPASAQAWDGVCLFQQEELPVR